MSTKNIVPRTTHEGSIGRTDKRWGAAYIDNITSTKVTATNIQTTGTAQFGGDTTVQGSITSQGTVSGSSGSFTGSVSGGSGNFSGNLTVGGTLSLQGAQPFFFLALSRLKAYKVGDIAFPASAPSWVRLECVQAGTTSVSEPGDYASIENAGEIITDGTTKFIVDDMRDMSSAGDVLFRPYLKSGYLQCDGQTVNRSAYPRLVTFITSNSLWTSNQTDEPWKFGQGDGSTTMTLPNYQERFVQGGASPAKREAGLPNITGDSPSYWFNNIYDLAEGWKAQTDFTTGFGAGGVHTWTSNTGNILGSVSNRVYDGKFIFNASRSNAIYGNSNTVQPPAIVLVPQIKY